MNSSSVGSSAGGGVASAALARLDTANAVAVRVARKALDLQEAQGQAIVDLIRSAGQVGAAGQPDGATGSGGRVDVRA